jgi:hypothetical protein
LPALYLRLSWPWIGDFNNGPATSATEEIPVSKLKTRIAAGITVIGLGGLAGLALGSSGEQQSTAAAVAEKPVVRTKVIRRTIHVTKHAKPKHPAATGTGGGALAAASGSSSGGQGSATTGSSSGGYGSSYSSSSESSPVTTSASGGGSVSAGGGEGGDYESEYENENEHESEDGGDD